MSPDKEYIVNTYINQSDGFKCSFSRNSFFTLSIQIHAYVGVNLVSDTVPDTCCLVPESNLK